MAVVKVGADGKAPAGLKQGDSVITNGGTYRITGVNADGSYVSTKVNDYTPSAGNGAAVGVNINDYGSDPESQKAYVNAIAKNAGDSYYDPAKAAATGNGIVAGSGVDIYGYDKQGNYVGPGSSAGVPTTAGGATGGYVVSGTSAGTDGYALTEYLKQQMKAQIEAELAGLKGAYEQGINGLDSAKDQLPAQFDAARNAAAAQNALERKAFDERAVASGLNTGTGGQAQLAFGNVLQRNMNDISNEQADALAEIELERANLQAEYEAAIAKAQADGNAALANALYNEMVRAQELARQDALIAAEQAQYAREQALEQQRYAQQLALEYGLVNPGDIGSISGLNDLVGLTPLVTGGNTGSNPPTYSDDVVAVATYLGIKPEQAQVYKNLGLGIFFDTLNELGVRSASPYENNSIYKAAQTMLANNGGMVAAEYLEARRKYGHLDPETAADMAKWLGLDKIPAPTTAVW